MDGDRPAEVRAHHLLDDYWQISAFNFVIHEEDAEVPNLPEGDPDRRTSMAVARIAGSGGPLA